MRCPRCGAENRGGARFCRECGGRLDVVCSNCGSAVEPSSKFCDTCGTPLPAASAASVSSRFASPQAYTPRHLADRILTSRTALEGERKQVTVLFADLKGSMELLADRDPEEARKLLDPVLELMMEAVHHYEGTVNQVMGDGIMALFGAPLAHEDHAVRACFAALRMQEAVKGYADEVRRRQGVPVHIRVGLNSGEVVVRSIASDLRMDYTAVGQTTHLAARMEQVALPGSILITPETLRLAEGYVQVKPFGPINVKGLAEPVDVYELTCGAAVRSRFQVTAARGLTRFVGRDQEMDQLRQAMERVSGGHGQIVALVGDPGVGKSRFVWEFTHSHWTQGWLVLESGSVSYGKATPYLPVIDLLKAYCKIQDYDDQRNVREKLTGKLLALDRSLETALPPLLALLGVPVDDAQWQVLDPRQRRQRTLDSVKRLLLRESQVQPLLLVFEDLHWIDSETQAILDALVESLPAAKVLLLVNYRPEYQHGWGSKTYYMQQRLDPLPPQSAHELLQALLGNDPSVASLRPLLIERTEGNPFFLEESVRALVETHALVGERGAYRLTRPLPAVQVPATVQAMLSSRIDRLASEDKRLLQSASVIGKDFPLSVLRRIVDLPEVELRDGLGRLQAAEFVYETNLFPELEHTFKHALTHEVTYNSLLHERRRELHRSVGESIEVLYPNRSNEFSPLLARHFVESAVLDKGLAYSLKAAERAEELYAHDQALRHYEQARACAEALRLPQQIEVINEAMGDVYFRRGLLDRAVEYYQRTSAGAGSQERRAAATLKMGKTQVVAGRPRRALELLQVALDELNPSTQRGELAEATANMGRCYHLLARHQEAISFFERARTIAEPVDDAGALTEIYAFLAGGYQHLARFQMSMEWARRCVELGERKKFPRALLVGYEYLAESLEFMGTWDESLAWSARSEEIARYIGAENRVGWAHHNRGDALYGKGDLQGALEAFKTALAFADATGEGRLRVWSRARLCKVEADVAAGSARAHGEEGASIADDLGERVLRAFNRYALAYMHLQEKEWDRAAELLNEVHDLLEGSDNRYVLLVSTPEAALVSFHLGREEEAMKMTTMALELARGAPSPHYEGLALRVRGQVLASRGFEDAATSFNGAVAILRRLGSRLELARALYHRALLRLNGGQKEAGREDLAEAQTLFGEVGAHRDRAQVEAALA